MSADHKLLKAVLPFVVIAGAVAGGVTMVKLRRPVETTRPESPLPLVRVAEVALVSKQLTVRSQGTVQPKTESDLVAQVAGRVTWIAPSFAGGAFFAKGDVLVKLDPFDYEQAVVRAEAEVARARLRLAQEEAEADVAREEWSRLGTGEATPLTRRELHVDDARAALNAAEAALTKARRDVTLTMLRAPYAGRVRVKNTDIGQFVAVGMPLGRLYGTDLVEVLLPLPDADLAFLDLPMGRALDPSTAPVVRLQMKFGGELHSWQGHIVRTDGEIDARTRMVHVIAEIEHPFGNPQQADDGRPALAPGMFVEAEILGRQVDGVVVMPRAALRARDRMLVVDREGQMSSRAVDVLRTTSDYVLVSSGLTAGERICLSPVEAFTEGMRVRTTDVAQGDVERGRS